MMGFGVYDRKNGSVNLCSKSQLTNEMKCMREKKEKKIKKIIVFIHWLIIIFILIS